MSERMFPIQSSRHFGKPHPLSIPWSVAEKAYAVYSGRYGRGQSLERLAERGGFCPLEMTDFHPTWIEEASEITRLTTERDEARTVAAECYNAARWELSDQKVQKYGPIIYQWAQALTRHADGEKEKGA